jgi:predicted N-acetyltransferase YhbS
MPLNLEIRSPDRSESKALCVFEFGEQKAESWGHRITASHYDWQTSRIGLLDGEIVSHVAIYDVNMRIGSAIVRSGGVNLVYTVKAHRGKGIMRAVFESSLDAMRANGYDTSVIVNGIRDFYTKFGYVFTWPRSSYTVATDDMPQEEPSLAVRAFKSVSHNDRHAELNNAEYEGLTGTVLKPTFLEGAKSTGEGYELLDPSGRVAAYCHVKVKQDLLYHDEYSGEPEEILRLLGKVAREHEVGSVRFHRLPDRCRLARLLRRMNSQRITEFSDTACFTSKIINLRSALEKMTDELFTRVNNSSMRDWSGNLVIRCEDQSAALTVRDRSVQVTDVTDPDHAIEGDQTICRLLFGAERPEFILEEENVACRGDGEALAKALFPSQDPLMLNQSC